MAAASAAAGSAHPLFAGKARAPERVDLITAGGRVTQVTHWRAAKRQGVILFSHGALSSPAKYDPLILPWVAAGFDVWAPLHVDSTDHPDTKAFAGSASWRARLEDMQALASHVNAESFIAAGHSYGGLVALTLGGASPTVPEGYSARLRDPRVQAVVAFSPPGHAPGLVTGADYASLAVPAMIQTGTLDNPPAAPGTKPDPEGWRSHLLAYDNARPGGDRYALVLDGVDHYFGGLICRPELPGPRQSAPMKQAVALSLQFLEGFGLGRKRGRAGLDARLSESGPVMLRRK
ncbi:alpha/beta hydrolase family protein [Sphingobium boeckii]|uniref:Pimeloyl-ACP methyl ester carboxylesterase n=1 Tax=Sphingobium boeckii TaxID=1082345 RepID=A0A7W9AIP9_9SPHN|nr:alpha/beta hydrolase [Sphingobium boeckii]MBB5686399.1 pimeloyl-ACP methyl ester carboxylesterase [Sphingobium boeckii]